MLLWPVSPWLSSDGPPLGEKPLRGRVLTRRRGSGNVEILKGLIKSVGSVESRLYGLPCFPYSIVSMACLRGRDQNVKLPKSPFR